MNVGLYRTLGIILHTVRGGYDCVWWLFLLYLPSIESYDSKCSPALPEAWVPAYAGTHAEPEYFIYLLVYTACHTP